VTTSDLAKYLMTRSTRGLSATAELLVIALYVYYCDVSGLLVLLVLVA